jgi:NAD(P)-dependent dehydrogenase (short-subunit alcohol dehydrogenase family)
MEKNKIALVTGSSRGIGKAIALTLAKDGFDVIIHCKDKKERANEVVSEIESLGKKAHLVQCNLVNDKEVEKMFEEIKKFTDKLDVLINSAGFDYGYMIEDYTMEQVRYLIDLILTAKICVTKYALPLLKNGLNPCIVNIASRMGGPTTIKTVGAYAPAEAGVIKFTMCCALEFAPKIRVNCVAPGLTETDLTRTIFKTKDEWSTAAARNPSGRVGQPQDVANTVSFLVSEKSSYITGDTILVTGGSNLC